MHAVEAVSRNHASDLNLYYDVCTTVFGVVVMVYYSCRRNDTKAFKDNTGKKNNIVPRMSETMTTKTTVGSCFIVGGELLLSIMASAAVSQCSRGRESSGSVLPTAECGNG